MIPLTRIRDHKVGNEVENKKPLNARGQRIIEEMRDNPNITTRKLHAILGIYLERREDDCCNRELKSMVKFYKRDLVLKYVNPKL